MRVPFSFFKPPGLTGLNGIFKEIKTTHLEKLIDPFLVVGVDVVGGLSGLVWSVQQTTVSRVTQKQLCDSLTSGPQ